MDLIFLILHNDYPFDTKLVAISAIGDICLCMEAEFLPYFEDSMKILN